MDGVHDMGGMDGFGKVEPEPNEPVFHADWEGRVLFQGQARYAHELPWFYLPTWFAIATPPLVLGGLLFSIVAPVVASYQLTLRQSPEAVGLTTELAAIATAMLGALTMANQRELAAALGVGLAALLAYKQPLHGFIQRLDREDAYAGLRLLIATFIVLPLLPDRTVDPWDALNPWSLWVLVLRVHRLDEPLIVSWDDAYGGCTSWVDYAGLPDPASTAARTVLSDIAFGAKHKGIREALPDECWQ